MWPLSRRLRPPPAPAKLATSCGRPAKSSSKGTWRPRTSSGRGSQTSTAAPARARRSASSACSAASSRAGSPGSRAVVSKRISAEASSTSSSRLSSIAPAMRCSRSFIALHSSAGGAAALLHEHAERRSAPVRVAERVEPEALGVVARDARARRARAVREQPLGLGDVEHRAQALLLARDPDGAEVDVDRDVLHPRRREGIAARHAAHVRAQARHGTLVAAGASLAVVGTISAPRASARASVRAAARPAPARPRTRRRRAARRRRPAGGRRALPPAGRAEAEAAVRADADEQLARPAQAVGRAGVVHLVGDDRPGDAAEPGELDHRAPGTRSRARASMPAARSHSTRSSGRSASSSARRPASVPSPGPISASVNGSGRPRRSHTPRRSAASARAKKGAAIGTVVNAPRAPSAAPRA